MTAEVGATVRPGAAEWAEVREGAEERAGAGALERGEDSAACVLEVEVAREARVRLLVGESPRLRMGAAGGAASEAGWEGSCCTSWASLATGAAEGAAAGAGGAWASCMACVASAKEPYRPVVACTASEGAQTSMKVGI